MCGVLALRLPTSYAPRRHHRRRSLPPRGAADERRPRTARRYERRVDPVAHRHPRAPHHARPSKATSYMASKAAQEILDRRGIGADEIDLIIVATVTPDMVFPATACLVQEQIGALERVGLRPLRRVQRLPLRAQCRGPVHRVRQALEGARHRRGQDERDRGLHRPHDVHHLRRRSRRGPARTDRGRQRHHRLDRAHGRLGRRLPPTEGGRQPAPDHARDRRQRASTTSIRRAGRCSSSPSAAWPMSRPR